MKNQKIKIFLTCLLICSSLKVSVADTSSLKIGVMVCLSSGCAEYGTNSLNSIRLAVDELNAQGGVLGRRIELVVEDSQDSTPSKSVTAYRKLTQDKDIHLFIGPSWSIGGMPIAPLVKANKDIIFISPSVGIKDFAESSDNIFNTWPPDEKGTRELAKYAFRQGWKRVAIMGAQDPWVITQSKAFADEFKKLGGLITILVEPLQQTVDIKADILRIKDSNPDAVFIPNTIYDIVAKELKNVNFYGPKLASLMEKDRVLSAEGSLDGTFFTLNEKPTEAFYQNYKKKYNIEPGIASQTAYDAIMLYVEAIRNVNSFEVDKIKDALHKIKDFHGASGVFSFNEQGVVDKPPVLWMVKRGEYERLEWR